MTDADALAAATDRLNQQIVASLRKAMDATFAALGFNWKPRDRQAEIAHQCRAIGGQREDYADALTDIICAVFTTFGHEHDRGLVHAEVSQHLGGTPTGRPFAANLSGRPRV